jgi:polypeptide N-acetylgalactosaminyltransferase
VHSVVGNTPKHFLHEVILVDDDSDFNNLKGELGESIQKYLPGKIEVIRNTKHEGLIQGSIMGAAHIIGGILVLLDSHHKVNVMWLQPLLAAIGEDPNTMVCPKIDIISADTLAYRASSILRAGSTGGCTSNGILIPFLN